MRQRDFGSVLTGIAPAYRQQGASKHPLSSASISHRQSYIRLGMADRDPNLVTSSLSRIVKRDGITVDVQIYKLEGGAEWTLEVVNSKGTSTVWDDEFPSDDDAYATFLQAVADEGMVLFLDQATIIPFRR